jgi:vanillate O-demethylase ferredoxin subunit
VTQARIEVCVTARRLEAEDVCAFELAAADGGRLPPFSAGAHIDVELGPGLVRQYSLCDPPQGQGRYLIAVLREPQSRGGSAAWHERVQIGDRLRISEPKNHFALVADARRSILLAGGIGVTPILTMAERLNQAGAPFVLHYAARSAARMAFRERLAASPFAPEVHLHLDDGAAAQRLDLDAVIGAPEEDVHLYVCGPGGLIEAALGLARARGWPEHQLHREFFSGVIEAADQGAFQVKIASTGRIYAVPADRPITAVLAEQGVYIPVSCQQGVCGTCLTSVLAGAPDHRDLYLTPDEQAANDQILPCCSRSRTPLLVLDL